MFIKLFLAIFAINAFANLEKAPANFTYQNENAVFVDFIQAEYELDYDFNTQQVYAETTIKLNQPIAGKIIFDLVPNIIQATIDGQSVNIISISSPEAATQYRLVDFVTDSGEHLLKIRNKIEKYITFNSSGIASSFWLSDLNDRRYLESFIPSNLEYDQYQMNFLVKFNNFPKKQIIKTNGEVVEISPNYYSIKYPEHYTSSSIFYHTFYDGRFNILEQNYTSIDGRILPVTVYSDSAETVQRFMTKSFEILKELESDYGPFLHPQVIIYAAGMGGMEYCGATMSDFNALGHELHHSYFARGIMPARGNSGWVDEAIASWRDDGYPTRNVTGFRSTQMAGHSLYRRFTDQDAYTKGAKFMGYLDSKLKSVGGLKKAIKDFKDHWYFKPFFTNDFKNHLENYSGLDLSQDFNQYVFGVGFEHSKSNQEVHNPMHPKLSDDFYQSLL